jgi:hypothetical protein
MKLKKYFQDKIQAGHVAWLWETKRSAFQDLKLFTNLVLQIVMIAEHATSTFVRGA